MNYSFRVFKINEAHFMEAASIARRNTYYLLHEDLMILFSMNIREKIQRLLENLYIFAIFQSTLCPRIPVNLLNSNNFELFSHILSESIPW